MKLLNQLKQKSLPIFCDEGDFRLVLRIYLKRQEEFKNLVLMLGGFHTAKCVQRCIGKNIKGTGLEDALVEIGVFGFKVMESILAATNYVQSLTGILILSDAIELVKWNAFWKIHDANDFKNSVKAIKKFARSSDKKDQQSCIKLHKQLKQKPSCNSLTNFQKACQQRSEICKYWDGFINLTSMLHNFISTDKEGD